VPEIFKKLESLISLKGALILHPESMKIGFDKLRLNSENDFINQGLNIKISLFST
jgi:hypothetical protein